MSVLIGIYVVDVLCPCTYLRVRNQYDGARGCVRRQGYRHAVGHGSSEYQRGNAYLIVGGGIDRVSRIQGDKLIIFDFSPHTSTLWV
jgi:hypothetical protein